MPEECEYTLAACARTPRRTAGAPENMEHAIGGILLLVLAGFMNGSFTLPMKFTRQWAWENTWFVWTLWALVVLPPLTAFITVPGLGGVYASVGRGVLWTVIACGAGWGISQVFFGLAVEAVGIALAFSVILGLSAAVGSLVPLIGLHPEQTFTARGWAVLGGVALVLVGVGVCAAAGRRREAALGKAVSPENVSVMRGLFFCVISGVGSALVNLGFTFGRLLADAAGKAGASVPWAPNAIWLPFMCAGGVPNLLYCLYLMRKNRTGAKLRLPATGGYFGLAGVMAICWFGSTLLYGIATGRLGELGTVLGWPLFMSLIVITASIWGVLTGEWKGAGNRPLRVMYAGVGVLVLAIFVLSSASR